MDIVSIVVTLLIVGVVLYLIGLIPMDAKILQIIRVVVILAVVLWLLGDVGLIPMRRWHTR